MRKEKANPGVDKGWFTGPWNSNLQIAVGYANRGVDEPHLHTHITEIYLATKGTAEVRVERETLVLTAGEMLAIDPGEAHTFLSSSPDYFHFVVHAPALSAEQARVEKVPVPRSRLGL